MVASLAAPSRARSATPSSPSSAAVATTSARSSPTSGHFGPLSSPDSSRRSARQNATRLRLRQPEGVIQGQLYSRSREGSTAQDVLRDFKGVLVSDFYSGYDGIKCVQQKCLIHLLRDINDD